MGAGAAVYAAYAAAAISAGAGAATANASNVSSKRLARQKIFREGILKSSNDQIANRQAKEAERARDVQLRIADSSKKNSINNQLQTKGIQGIGDFGDVTNSVLNEKQASV